jgi:hypothetical protein
MTDQEDADSGAPSPKVNGAPSPKTKRSASRKKKSGKRGPGRKVKAATSVNGTPGTAKFPRHSVTKALRIPKAVLEQNAGRACSDKEALNYAGLSFNGPSRVEISSAIKYGLLDRPSTGVIGVTDLAKQILRPQKQTDAIDGLRKAVLMAPEISDVYTHYRGENVPDDEFFRNALVDTFRIPRDKVDEFKAVFFDDLTDAQLMDDVDGKKRILDVSTSSPEFRGQPDETLKKISKGVKIEQGDSCFVMMPFAEPIGGYYKLVYEVAILKAGLRPMRADDDIFATGKIIDQVWEGISKARVLVAELTGRNPNVFYELGLAHALNKPVVLVSSNQTDVPFDLKHIRVIYYDMSDPFWGDKLISKVAENIVSALKNPGEALLKLPE